MLPTNREVQTCPSSRELDLIVHRPMWHSESSSLSFGIELQRKVQNWGFRQKTSVRSLSSSAVSLPVRYLNLTPFPCFLPQCIFKGYWWGDFWESLCQVKFKGSLRPNSSSALLWLDTQSCELWCANVFGELSHLFSFSFTLQCHVISQQTIFEQKRVIQ